MKKLTSVLLCGILVMSLSACSSRYRYECQNPENWKEAKCNPPVCEATGTCTKDLVKENNNG